MAFEQLMADAAIKKDKKDTKKDKKEAKKEETTSSHHGLHPHGKAEATTATST